MKLTTTIFTLVGITLASAPALAASDYLLELDGVKGESAITLDSWSFGACNAGQCTTITSPRDATSGQSTGKVAAKGRPNSASWDLATNKGARTAGGVNVAVGDVDGDGRADLAFVTSQSEVSSLSLNFTKISYSYRQACMGQHIKKAVLSYGTDSYEITDATITCTGVPDESARTIDQTPARISTNMTVGKQTQGATFGEKVQSGMMTMTFTSGQMKYTKTGHVTLLK